MEACGRSASSPADRGLNQDPNRCGTADPGQDTIPSSHRGGEESFPGDVRSSVLKDWKAMLKGIGLLILFTTMLCLWGLRFRADCDVLTPDLYYR